MTDALRWIETAIQKARDDVTNKREPNIGRVGAHTFAALAYLTEYDRLTEQGKKAAEGQQP